VPLVFDQGTDPLHNDRPRQFVQFNIDFHSTITDGSQLEFIQFAASEPLVCELVAQIGPQQAPTGTATTFTYKILPASK
jgi:hypothetical protein